MSSTTASRSLLITLPTLVTGTYNVSVLARDVLGNVGPAVIAVFTVDTDAPRSWFMGLMPPRYTSSGALVLHVNGTDDTSHVSLTLSHDDGVTVDERTVNAVVISTNGSTPVRVVGEVAYNALIDGNHTFTVHAADAAGNGQSVVRDVVTMVVDSVAPTVTSVWVVGEPNAIGGYTRSTVDMQLCTTVDDDSPITAVNIGVDGVNTVAVLNR